MVASGKMLKSSVSRICYFDHCTLDSYLPLGSGKEIIKEFRKVFKSLYFCRNGAFWAGQPVDFNFANKRILLLRLFFICHGKNNGILFPKLFWLTVGKNCFSDWEFFLKFQAEGREFANWLRSLEQFIQIVKLQNNFWNRTFF